jgi:osmotically-inducible protein OsmY
MDPRDYELGRYVPGSSGVGGPPRAVAGLAMGSGMASYVPEMSGVAPGAAMNHVGHGPKGYTREDERILEDVCERLTLDPMLDAREISVEVKDGEAIFTGEVESRQMKRMAEDIAFSVWGVKDVSNQIRIEPTEET